MSQAVRGLLAEHCFACHGPDAEARKADLRLDQPHRWLGARSETALVLPGRPEESELWLRVAAEEAEDRMPPPDFPRPLSAEDKELLRDWIAGGAKWQELWALQPPARPPLPEVKQSAWPRNPVDRFALAKLEAAGLQPSPPADRRRLVRRLHLDLTGLPPAEATVEAFLADQDPQAYEKLVDRLLQSQAHAERLTVAWLDLARYADSDGYHEDGPRSMWPYRDYVLQSFWNNKAFDRFTVEQLAGDLLPNADRESRVATAFHRNGPTNSEPGADPKEYAFRYAADRLETTAMTWLGLTVQCAQCHDHKFDPIRQKEYFGLLAFFNQVPEQVLWRGPKAPPVLALPNEQQQKLQLQLQTEAERLQEQQRGLAETLRDTWKDWLPAWLAEQDSTPVSTEDLQLHFDLEIPNLEEVVDRSGSGQNGLWMESGGPEVPRMRRSLLGQALDFPGLDSRLEAAGAGDFEADQGFALSFWVLPGEFGKERSLAGRVGEAEADRGWEVRLNADGLAEFRVVHRWPEAALAVAGRRPLQAGLWQQLVVQYDGSGKVEGLKIFLNGAALPLRIVADQALVGSIRSQAPLRFGGRKDSLSFRGSLDEIRLYSETASEALWLARFRSDLVGLFAGLTAEDVPELAEALFRATFLRHSEAGTDYRQGERQLSALQDRRHSLEQAIPTVRVMEEVDPPRPTYFLHRGDFRDPGDAVAPGVPACLPPLQARGERADRLDFARWLVDANHPLTARVRVNQLWALVFGRGLVHSMEDFGSQVQGRHHPQLLDWLAVEFQHQHWDQRAILRLLVTSALYRQSSRSSEALLQKDPNNLWWSRYPKRRLQAEFLRDQALAVSGLLQPRFGGPPVMPYQPPGLWLAVARESSLRQEYELSSGADLHRRSLYSFWKRSVLNPTMAVLDAPSREACFASRTTTNTPLQALVTMHDPTFVEAARVLAEQVLMLPAASEQARLQHLFQRCLMRAAEEEELNTLLPLVPEFRTYFEQQPEAVARLLTIGSHPVSAEISRQELATWTALCQILLNLDEILCVS